MILTRGLRPAQRAMRTTDNAALYAPRPPRRRAAAVSGGGPDRAASISAFGRGGAWAYEWGMAEPDAVVVGSGPNGLAAAIELARNGRSVLLVEANDTIGGAARAAEMTPPGVVDDVCSTPHPPAPASPLLRSLPPGARGVEAVHPGAPG